NGILALSQEERSDLTTAHFTNVEIGSAWMNQTIRNARARTKAKRFTVMLLETNNQNWTLHKVGDTYSVGFNLLRGVKKRIPLHAGAWRRRANAGRSSDLSVGSRALCSTSTMSSAKRWCASPRPTGTASAWRI